MKRLAKSFNRVYAADELDKFKEPLTTIQEQSFLSNIGERQPVLDDNVLKLKANGVLKDFTYDETNKKIKLET